ECYVLEITGVEVLRRLDYSQQSAAPRRIAVVERNVDRCRSDVGPAVPNPCADPYGTGAGARVQPDERCCQVRRREWLRRRKRLRPVIVEGVSRREQPVV